MRKSCFSLLAVSILLCGGLLSFAGPSRDTITDNEILSAFQQQHIRLTREQLRLIRPRVVQAVDTVSQSSPGNSKVGFAAVEIATTLKLNPMLDTSVTERIEAALNDLATSEPGSAEPSPPSPETLWSWEDYFDRTVSLTDNADFLALLSEKQFHPVKISWEDIGRYENSVWGDRISDVGIWVRKDESDPLSAELALSVRRDSNFRDKVLMVPAHKIKIHTRQGGRTVETSLPDRLKQLGLTSKVHDTNVIVSNQFAVVPVPSRAMRGVTPGGNPPRAAFNFSIYPYGSTNFVITDVIEGSSNAVVGPGSHQLLFADINGKKAPFTASRAEDRPDLVKLEQDLKAKGMDVDVQRYYLIQIPLKKNARGITLSNMGTPPMRRFYTTGDYPMTSPPQQNAPAAAGAMPESADYAVKKSARHPAQPGLAKVAIGHGETEGRYREGSGYRNQRAEEPIRVTVVYFVTPKGSVTEADMQTFTTAFENWDKQAIWGGSFVVKNQAADE